MSLPQYDQYKASGVEWLGEIPAHWKIERLKRSILSCRNGIWGEESKGDENDVPCVRVADFNRQTLSVVLDEPTIRNVSEKERVGRILNQGDLLLEKSGGGELQPVGCVVLYDDPRPAICSNFIARMQLTEGMNPSYWRYVHAAAYSIRLTTASINQTSGIQNLDQHGYFDERAAFPPPEEQTAIAAFLDRETAKIDALVAEQRRLIELLKEKRQAVISHAVTKGLNPNAPMKDSGIEWLGEIPAHWGRTIKLLELAKKQPNTFVNGPFGSDLLTSELTQEGIPVIYIRDLKLHGYQRVSEVCVTQEKAKQLQFCNVLPNDVLLAKVGDPPGLTVVYPESEPEGIVTQDVIRIRVEQSIVSPEYLAYLLNSDFGRVLIDNISVESTRTRIGLGDLKSVKVVLPPPPEQRQITAYLDEKVQLLFDLQLQAEQAISLLQERRTALISAAVTGKIDVRGQGSAGPDLRITLAPGGTMEGYPLDEPPMASAREVSR
jgi:type I restriction enzyme S subunit